MLRRCSVNQFTVNVFVEAVVLDLHTRFALFMALKSLKMNVHSASMAADMS